jgi:2,3-dihydroxyphenylpropionate 1,2-dioxygenase
MHAHAPGPIGHAFMVGEEPLADKGLRARLDMPARRREKSLMSLVYAAALPHTPQLLVRPETEDRDLVLRVHAAYARVKSELAAIRPDAICLIGGDHIEGFFLNAVPALAVFVGAEVSGKFDRYRYTFAVHEPLARAILEQGIEGGFDLTYSQDIPLDYAFYVPLHFAMPEPSVPIVPLYVNVYLPPQPTPRRCYAWGQALRGILDARPERVALIASGGLSHYPGTDRYASPDFEWDRQRLAALEAGRGAETAALTGDELDKAGNAEFRTWITLLGGLGSTRAVVVCYEPSWHHGNAVVTWPV